ncbi:MAG: AAA family ATPase [Cyanobacteria bacterium J06554_11]
MVEVLQLDRANACLWQDSVAIPLTPKAMAVVDYLVAHTGSIATKSALLDAVWAHEDVSEYALTSIIRDLRRALGDSTKTPRYIQTVHRRGYRWIGTVSDVPGATSPEVPQVKAASLPSALPSEQVNEVFTGRTQELEKLRHHLQLAATGKRQLVFLTGEAGIGKTTLLEKFSNQVDSQSGCSVALGQCIEKYGAGEAYRPVLEALNRFCHTTKGERYISTLEQYAPSWLMQMPPLLTPEQLLRLQAQGAAPKERWLRELAEALEVITRDHLLVLILEDLHWGDRSTVELLDMLARRKEFAKLCILASYRPAEVYGLKDDGSKNGENHPLRHTKQELQLHGLCHEIALNYLTQQEVESYLIQRFPGQFSPQEQAQPTRETSTIDTVVSQIYQRTEGSPLFVVNVVESLVEKKPDGSEAEYLNPPKLLLNLIPDNLKQLIHLQFDALDIGQQRVLEAASVEGVEFLSVTVAASLNLESEQVEQCIDDLVKLNHLITIDDVEILPDGSLSTRYRFIHALYQEGLYRRITQSRRVRLHRAVAKQLETIYGHQTLKIAAQLALHFEQGMDYAKAIAYLQKAGTNALKRSAHAAAVEHFHRGLALLPKVSSSTAQNALELTTQTLLGTTLMTLKGQGAPEVGTAYRRAQQICLAHSPEQFEVALGLWRHTFITGDLSTSLDLGQQCFTLAKQNNDLAQLGHARYALAGTLMYQGELAQALTHAEAGLEDYRRLSLQLAKGQQAKGYLANGGEAAVRHSQDPSATLMAYRAWILFFLGYWEQAVAAMNELFELDIVRSHPQTTVTSLTYSGILYLYLREFELAQQQLQKAIDLAQTWQIAQFATIATFFLDCTLQSASAKHAPEILKASKHQRLSNMQTTLTRRRAAGAELHTTGYLNRIAEGYLTAHQAKTSLTLLSQSQAIAEQSSERIFEADTTRLMGDLLLLPGDHHHPRKAESLLKESLAIAKQQQSATFELRAATRLAKLWQTQGKTMEANNLLRPVYSKFTEGFNYCDLRKAHHILECL